jgi:hypothetical protein
MVFQKVPKSPCNVGGNHIKAKMGHIQCPYNTKQKGQSRSDEEIQGTSHQSAKYLIYQEIQEFTRSVT